MNSARPKYFRLAKNVTANAHVMSGVPCIIGRRLPTRMIRGMFVSGDSLTRIAKLYGLDIDAVEDVLRYELSLSRYKKAYPRATLVKSQPAPTKGK